MRASDAVAAPRNRDTHAVPTCSCLLTNGLAGRPSGSADDRCGGWFVDVEQCAQEPVLELGLERM